jgi:hypothetical protein
MTTGQLHAVASAGNERFRLLKFEDLEKLPRGEWLVDRIIEVNSQVLVYGPSGDGKSFVALGLALSVASGEPWHGRKVKQGPVVYIAAEGGRGILRRVKAWKRKHPNANIDNAFWVIDAPQLRNPVERSVLSARLQGLRPVLIIVDTLARTFVGGDENTAKDMGEWIAGAAKPQAEFGATVLTVHHSGKSKSAGERGSSALPAAVDTIIRVEKDGNRVSLTCEKQKDEDEFQQIDLTLRVVELDDGTSCVLDGGAGLAAPVMNVKLEHRKALEALRGLPDATARSSDWRRACHADDSKPVPERTFHNWRRFLADHQFVEAVGKGVYRLTEKGRTATANGVPSNRHDSGPATAATATPP